MEAGRWAQIEELFHRAAECDVEKRAALLDEACNGDGELRREVESLLACEASADERVRAAVHDGLASFGLSLVGETISHYKILDLLGSGGMGLVYRAEDLKLGRQVALKFLPEESTTEVATLARFEREARAASALEHPNICPIYEFGEHRSRPFLVMQLLEGQTLRELLEGRKIESQDAQHGTSPSPSSAREALPLAEVLNLSIQIANGLEAAHHRGIIHRDIKPANIFVTHQGQAKILDFGLAKLAHTGLDDHNESENEVIGLNPQAIRRDSRPLATSDPSLSRTGVAMGTAAYMSPEQACGEKLDARTDVFSFGLVLYEMATGRRAFEGDTGPLLHNAILHQAPTPARQLNSRLPVKLGAIIHRALEKNREARYQTISELRKDLEQLKPEIKQGKRAVRWALATASALAILFVGAFVWLAKTRFSSHEAPSQINFQQLTINSSENPVTSGAISPNGKYIAYTDSQGIHIKDIDSGLTHAVAYPLGLKKESVNFEIFDSAWFPDNMHFLANAHPVEETAETWSSQTADIWLFSKLNEAPRKLRAHAIAWSVSPDGKMISFGANVGKLGERENWLMNSEGQQARKLFDTDENSSVGGFVWSPDSQRGLYIKADSSGDTLMSRDIHGGPPVSTLTFSAQDVRGDFSWLPDGRLIYQVADSGAGYASVQDTCNFWTMKLDVHTGRQLENPKRLTNWTGFCIGNANATADGKRLAFLRSAAQWAVYVADVEGKGTHLTNMRRLTLDESWNFTQDWTNDSKSVVFTSNRTATGQFAIYKQSLENDEPELISTGLGNFRDTPVSPDGKWLFAIPWPKAPDPKDSYGLMRVPLTGGAPEMVTSTLTDSIFCARPPSSLCVLSERTEDRKQLVFTSIDPVKGRGRELARFSLDPAIEYNDFDVSPDGTRLAVSGSTEGPIHILTLRGKEEAVIPVKFNDVQEFHWSADGKGLYVPDQTKRSTALLYVDLHGKTHTLWEQRGGGWVWARPSPDGRHLAIETSITSNNVWVMENF